MMKQVKLSKALRTAALTGGLFITASAFGQQVVVKGHVKDSTGEPIIGATVRVDGTEGGTITDFDGNFSLKADAKSVIRISYIGYETATAHAGQNINIILKEEADNKLNEVVVIGYGRAKKTDLTGSVTAMKPDELSKGITNNATDMLVGKVAGVDVQTAGGAPGAGAQIRIRGGASLTANNDPLYVIDGLVIDNNTANGMSNILANINPNDIESFTVLKDASATAIYGSRASNGVVIVTTKKGRAGQKPTFSYNGDFTVSTIRKKLETLNAAEFRNLAEKLGCNTDLLGNADTDWQKEIFRTTVSTSHSLSVTGGLKNMPYRISAGYNLGNGILKTSWMRRFNTSINLAPSFFDKHLNFNITAKYMYEKNRYADSGAVGSALAMDPTRPVRTDAPDYWMVGGYYQTLMSYDKFSNPAWNKTPDAGNVPQNPVAQLMNKHCYAHANDYSGNAEVDYKIHGFEDLHIHASIGAQYTATEQKDTNSPYSFSNNYYGKKERIGYWKYNIVGNAYAQYMHTFGKHDIDIMGGAEQSHYHRTGTGRYGQGIDPVTGEAKDPQPRSKTEWATHNSIVSYFGRLNYSFYDRYLITATFRADGSSRFAKGKKWGYFPSAALAWKINNESFMKNVKWLNDLKLRVGWGKTGQQNIDKDFYYMPLYVESDRYSDYPFGSDYIHTMRPNKYNDQLTWETTETWNAGIDFAALNNRFTFSLDGYIRNTEDLLAEVATVAGTSLGDKLLQNVGSLRNYGLELSFDVKPVVTKDFTWDLTYNVGWNKNEVRSLKAGEQDWVWNESTNAAGGTDVRIQRFKVGQPVNAFYVFQQVYDENGKPIEGVYVDRDGNGQINAADRYYYKSPAADVIMGLTSKFLYKRWDFSFSLRASLGNYVYDYNLAERSQISKDGIYNHGAFVNTMPSAVELGFTSKTSNPTGLSDYFVRNASFLKCSNITLGYSFPSLLKYAGQDYFSGRVYLTAQNPFIITKYKGLDPEVANGVDRDPYPRPMSFQLGVNFNF